MQRSALCRSRRELSNEYLLAKFGFDAAENEPCQVCRPLLREGRIARGEVKGTAEGYVAARASHATSVVLNCFVEELA